MSTTNELKSLDFVEAADTAMATAVKLANAVEAEKKAAAKLASPLIERFVSLRLLEDHERTQAIEKLASHDGSIELIGNLLTVLQNERASYQKKLALHQGETVDEGGLRKSASIGASGVPQRARVYGSPRGTGERRDSDRALLAGLGLDL